MAKAKTQTTRAKALKFGRMLEDFPNMVARCLGTSPAGTGGRHQPVRASLGLERRPRQVRSMCAGMIMTM
jgi:hypothetical protein